MKCFVEIDCPELDIIQKEVIQYLTDYTKLLTHKPDSPWNIIQNTLEFAQQCPNVFKFCRKHQLVPRDVSFVVSHDQTSGLPIHVGGWPLVVKMNFPIMTKSKPFPAKLSIYNQMDWKMNINISITKALRKLYTNLVSMYLSRILTLL